MGVSVENRVTLRKIYIEIGRMCTLSCKHCCKGESEKLSIDYKYIDALLDNVYFIDEIVFTGGEPLLYLNEMEDIVNMVTDRVKLNYITILTNGTIKSEKFVELWNRIIEKTTFPDKAELHFSIDKYHEFNNSENIKWYEDKIKKGIIIKYDFETGREDHMVVYDGNASKWKLSDYEHFEVVQDYVDEITKAKKKGIEAFCTGEDNKCGYCDVKNCVYDFLYLSADGYIYDNTFYSYQKQRKANHKLALGKITDKDIYSMVTEWNNLCEKSETTKKMWMKIEDMKATRIVDCLDSISLIYKYVEDKNTELLLEEYDNLCELFSLIENEIEEYSEKKYMSGIKVIRELKGDIDKYVCKVRNPIFQLLSSFIKL